MIRRIAAGLSLALVASGACGAEMSVSYQQKGKKAVVVDDYKTVPLTVLLLRPSDIGIEETSLLCSPSTQAIFVATRGQVIALNKEAESMMGAKTKATINSISYSPIKPLDKASVLLPYPDVASKLAGRAMKDCPTPEPEPVVVSRPPAASQLAHRQAGNAMDAAYALCALVDAADFASEPCDVSVWNSSVRITADMRSGEARAVCKQLAAASKKMRLPFAPGWKIEVLSPFSGEKTIAYCQL